ncbi:pyridoxal-5'-phosphate phosphatase [Piscinibacter sakaiensis]|uniref:Pyridoxal-5'-phosphate phosphatase n=1 Tax=Piscinibacter sakaiensis TaxID=1547922 RepID=A0A0K8NY28_PISS1|nr:pyridoxal-5'-phosphate phosphatase [Piscinibacter sakaiensis]
MRRLRRRWRGGLPAASAAPAPASVPAAARPAGRRPPPVWLFDLDDTLHDASHAAFGQASAAMNDYIVRHIGLTAEEAAVLRQGYWRRYGATLLGLVRHHGVVARHFLDETHALPGLEERLRCHAADRRALCRLPGRRYVVTNGPRAYAARVLRGLRLHGLFDGVLGVEDMRMFGEHRPKPDRRALRHLLARLKLVPARCVLVEDTLSNQKAVRRLGLRTVWMQGYQPPGARAAGGRARGGRPAYVCARIKRIAALRALQQFSR